MDYRVEYVGKELGRSGLWDIGRVISGDGIFYSDMYCGCEWKGDDDAFAMKCGEIFAFTLSEEEARELIEKQNRRFAVRVKDGQMPDVLKRAIRFATEKHEGTFRKGTCIPYITHPMEAMAITATMTDDAEVLAAAVLHDTVEDTDTTLEDIVRLFGKKVGRIVAGMSEKKRGDRPAEETWEERKKEAIVDTLRSMDWNTPYVALGDKLSNMRAIARDYREIGNRLWERFHQKDKKKIGWYYRSMCEVLSREKNTAAWKELDALIREVFESEKED